MISNVKALQNSANELNISNTTIHGTEAALFIEAVYQKFDPAIRANHLSISNDECIKLKTDDHELSFSIRLENEPVFVFFQQSGRNKDEIFVLLEGQKLSKVIGNAGGMEYFITNKEQTFLISVNWYVIEIVGSIKNLFLDIAIK